MSDNQPTAAPVPPLDAAVAPPSEVVLPAPSGGGGLLAMIERLATRPDLKIDVFERLLVMRRQEEDRAAERAFNSAMSLAKGELEPVLKTRDVDFTAKTGSRTKYKYEQFADVARVVDPVFARHGLAYRFAVEQGGELVKVTCVVSHADGHSERVRLEAKVDPGSTGMSMVQALGSALTYLQRYSLRAAIGLAAAVDDDGRAAGGASPRISAEQASELRRLIDESGRSEARMLGYVGAEHVEAMTVDQWKKAMDAIGMAKPGGARRGDAGPGMARQGDEAK